jgi:hypothetical protein
MATTDDEFIAMTRAEPRRFMRGLMVGLVLAIMAWAAIAYGLIWLFG